MGSVAAFMVLIVFVAAYSIVGPEHVQPPTPYTPAPVSQGDSFPLIPGPEYEREVAEVAKSLRNAPAPAPGSVVPCRFCKGTGFANVSGPGVAIRPPCLYCGGQGGAYGIPLR